MLLVADVGNTQTLLGLWNGKKVLERWRIGTSNISTEDELLVHVNHFLDFFGHDLGEVKGFCVASVVPPLNNIFRYFSVKYLKMEPLFVETKGVTWINWNVKRPDEMGADRVANVVAARELFKKNVVIVDFGTAITLDILSDAYEGGSILSGPHMVMHSLFANTAKLPLVDEKVPVSSIGKDTPTNIQSGVMLGTVFAVDGLISRYESELSKKFKIISTGGHGEIFMKMSSRIEKYLPDLTLSGVSIYFSKKNHKK